MKVEDNFLVKEDFDELQNFFMGDMLPWYYNSTIDFVDDEDKYQFIHLFYDAYVSQSAHIEIINPLLSKISPAAIWRIKVNLLTKTPNIIENAFHQDMGKVYKDGVEIDSGGHEKLLKQATTSIFYMNTNNGYTKFEDGTKVESVENRLISFPANTKHTGTSCTDEQTRIVINFNYFK